jgi:2-polyprenyl-6-methoxyphenol hydroxylase-like FAD-dependent oxidoreductase
MRRDRMVTGVVLGKPGTVAQDDPTNGPDARSVVDMASKQSFDVIVVGGGIAGSALAGVLARSGLGVLVVEKEARFRDRIRGESTYPWGVAEALRTGLGDLLKQAGAIELSAFQNYKDRRIASTYVWATDSIDGVSEIGFSHPRLQEEAFAWAGAQGATTIRPAKATGVAHIGTPSVTVVQDGHSSEYSARLIVGADGRLSMARSWLGAETIADPETNRFGGPLVSGVRTDDRHADNVGDSDDIKVNWFATSIDMTRLYLRAPVERLRALGVERSFEAIVAVAAPAMPEGALDAARLEGPIGFFANNDIWASRLAGDGIVLIGDAAGSADPSYGLGTCLLFRDVRELSELLLADRDWRSAIGEFAVRRRRYYEVILARDRWVAELVFGKGEAADRAREGHKRAEQDDPTLGGFDLLEARGPDGLVADEAARRMFFGESLA